MSTFPSRSNITEFNTDNQIDAPSFLYNRISMLKGSLFVVFSRALSRTFMSVSSPDKTSPIFFPFKSARLYPVMFSVASFDHITLLLLSLIITPLLTLLATSDNCSSSAIIFFCSLISLPLAYHLSFLTAKDQPIHFAVPSFNLIRASTSKLFFPADNPSEKIGIKFLRSSSRKKSQMARPSPSSGE